MNLLANPNRRDFLRRSLGLGAGAGLVALGLGGCSRGLPDGGTEEIAVADVPVGGGVIVGWYVITQPVAGEFKAFHANCPHANVKVTGVDQTGVLCSVHAARFDLADGDVLAGPTELGLTPAPFTREGDMLIVTMPEQ